MKKNRLIYYTALVLLLFAVLSIPVRIFAETDDKKGPVIESLTVDKTEATVGDVIRFELKASDASGLDLSSSRVNIKFPKGTTQRLNFKEENGKYIASLEITDSFFDGNYSVVGMRVYDIYGNNTPSDDYNSIVVKVSGAISDLTGPTIESLTIDKSEATVGDIINFELMASDASPLDLSSSRVSIKSPAGTTNNIYFTEKNGKYIASLEINETFFDGKYTVNSLRVYDVYGNYSTSNKYNSIVVKVSGAIPEYDAPVIESFIKSKTESDDSYTVSFILNATDKSGIDFVNSYISVKTPNGTKNIKFTDSENNVITASIDIDKTQLVGGYKISGIVLFDIYGNKSTSNEYNNVLVSSDGKIFESTAPVIDSFSVDKVEAFAGERITYTLSATDESGIDYGKSYIELKTPHYNSKKVNFEKEENGKIYTYLKESDTQSVGAYKIIGLVVYDVFGNKITSDVYNNITVSIISDPTPAPTQSPTQSPTTEPAVTPTSVPANSPTPDSTATPGATSVATPTAIPTTVPTATPTSEPTATPEATSAATPTAIPTTVPTATPTSEPTATPEATSLATPTAVSTTTPTVTSTATPTAVPTESPEPTISPTSSSTEKPSSLYTLEADVDWSGLVKDEKWFEFTPDESGFYRIKCEGEEGVNVYYDISCLGNTLFENDHNYDFVYFTQNVSYDIKIQTNIYNTSLRRYISSEGIVKITVSKIDDLCELNENKQKFFSSDQTSTILAYFTTKGGTYTYETSIADSLCVATLVNKDGYDDLEVVYDDFEAIVKSIKLNLKDNQQYYFIYERNIKTYPFYASLKKDTRDITGVEILNWYNGDVHTGMVRDDNYDSDYAQMPSTWLINDLEVKLLYSNGESEITQITHEPDTVVMYDVYLNYDNITSLYEDGRVKPGKYTVWFGFHGLELEKESPYDLNVKKITDVDFYKLKIGDKYPVEIENDNLHDYVYTTIIPSDSGYYCIQNFSELDFDYFFDNYTFVVFDEDDNIVEYNQDNGWKLLKNKDYVLCLSYNASRNPDYWVYYGLIKSPNHKHVFGVWKTIKDANNTDYGIKERVCYDCGYEETEKIPLLQDVTPSPSLAPSSTPNINPNLTPTQSPISIPSTTPIVTPTVEAKDENSVPPNTKFKTVKNKKSKKLYIKWNKKSGVDGYQIQYALNSSFTKSKKTKTLSKSKNTLTVKKLKKKKKYYVRIRTYVTDSSGKRVYSNWSSVKKVTIKK